MLNARNIHFIILGLILGASTGYVTAFYKAQANQPPPPPLSSSEVQGEMPAGHPEVNNDQMLEAMRQAVETDPSNPEILQRYAMALFDAGHFADAQEWFRKAVDLQPNSVEAHSMYGAALWRLGDRDGARRQLETALQIDPRNIPSLHGLVLMALERQDATEADRYIKQIEAIEPTYDQLPDLRTRLQALRTSK